VNPPLRVVRSSVLRLVEVEQGVFNRRFRVELADGAAVEAVHYRGDTLCISSQVGCAVGCSFCASGASGLSRQLSSDELWQQVEAARSRALQVTRVTVSGVGEPLHNHRHVLELIARCRSERIAPSVTTSGGPLERLRELLVAHHNGVTVSVHAGTEAVRARIVPRGPALEPLFATLAEVVPQLSRSRQRKVALAYLALAAINDADAELDAFIARAAPLGLSVHLYAYNPVSTSDCRRVDRARYEAMYARLTAAGLTVRMSSQARIEANGGCGTLIARRQ
jgi:23S rRNA (adenine2503-C2)-methyltransferase